MHELNNAVKDASLSVYFQPGVNLDHITVQSQTSMMMTTSRRSASTVVTTSHHGDDQPSADVASQDLCEVCLTAQQDRPTRQVFCHAATGAFVVPVSLRSRKKVAAARYAER